MSACVSSWKVVQTELDPSSYGRLKLLADRKAQPIKAVLREAVQELLAREEGDGRRRPVLRPGRERAQAQGPRLEPEEGLEVVVAPQCGHRGPIMERLGLKEAFTFDSDYKTHGFTCLP